MEHRKWLSPRLSALGVSWWDGEVERENWPVEAVVGTSCDPGDAEFRPQEGRRGDGVDRHQGREGEVMVVE